MPGIPQHAFWPSTSNYVCFGCRTNNKRGGECPECHAPMVNIGFRWRVPRRTNDRDWKWMQERWEAKGGGEVAILGYEDSRERKGLPRRFFEEWERLMRKKKC